MSNELQSLSILFQNRLFRIPDYQRGYAWKHDQLTDFWDDLVNLPKDRNHYTGLLSLKALERKKVIPEKSYEWLLDIGYKLFHVVDGQQRLTTFSILMFEIATLVKALPENTNKSDDKIFLGYESLKEIKAKYIFRKRPPQNLITTYFFGYETDNPSEDYLKYKVFNEPFGGTVVETYYTKNLNYAKAFFANNLQALFADEGKEGVVQLYYKLTQRLMFNLHEIEDDYDVYVAFETMNNRGKKLTNLELLKNRLIYLTTLFDDHQLDPRDKAKLRENINQAWKEVYHQLGRKQNAPLSDDEFLRAHWITYFSYSRRGGDDYIRFLLEKFSAKNVFQKKSIVQTEEMMEPTSDIEAEDGYDSVDIQVEDETITTSKLEPNEISNYINSIKEIAKYWFYSYFPDDSPFSDEERIWISKLNRIGIGHFRPLVVAALSHETKTSPEERIALFKSIERFIFVSFRIGGFQASYQSSVYYNKSRELSNDNISLASISKNLDSTVENDKASAITAFVARTNRRFNSGPGFYIWRDLRYFLFEYEHDIAVNYGIEKIDWNLFTRVEKDKISIEHILPQTPTEWYWRNTYRMYTEDEIKQLAGSLGNLLPLSLSINSSLQNDSFKNKKKPPTKRRRGYTNGSHSEIEVAQISDWTAKNIFKRGLALLNFMEKRWAIKLTDEQKSELLHISFVHDGRKSPPELPKKVRKTLTHAASNSENLSDLRSLYLDFWTNFVNFCKEKGRDDIASRKPKSRNWYNMTIGSRDYHIFLQVFKENTLRIGLYVYRQEDFSRLELIKSELETAYGSQLEWYTSRKTSVAKRILHSIEADVHNPTLFPQHFTWYISQFDRLRAALEQNDTR